MKEGNLETNTVWHHATVTRSRRNDLNTHNSFVLWFTGLSGSGKSTLAHAVEEELYKSGYRTFVLDGDSVRQGPLGRRELVARHLLGRLWWSRTQPLR